MKSPQTQSHISVTTDHWCGAGRAGEGARRHVEGDVRVPRLEAQAVLAPAGAKHALKNLGPDPAVLLVFVGPRLA